MTNADIWKEIPNTDGRYFVSSSGEVKCINYKGKENNARIIKQHICQGYAYVWLHVNGKDFCKKVHRLVAEAFVYNPNNHKIVNHKDENKLNNSSENLEWCDTEYNNNYGTRNKRISVTATNGKQSKPVIATIIESGKEEYYESIQEAGRKGFCVSNIHGCINGKRYRKHKGRAWRYA